VSYAVEQEINLILIGAHGQGFKLGTLFGSNTDRVLREAPCPVLVVRPLKPAAQSVGLNGEGKG
jgi:nucleotide-binding universal stress UspA family protein